MSATAKNRMYELVNVMIDNASRFKQHGIYQHESVGHRALIDRKQCCILLLFRNQYTSYNEEQASLKR